MAEGGVGRDVTSGGLLVPRPCSYQLRTQHPGRACAGLCPQRQPQRPRCGASFSDPSLASSSIFRTERPPRPLLLASSAPSPLVCRGHRASVVICHACDMVSECRASGVKQAESTRKLAGWWWDESETARFGKRDMALWRSSYGRLLKIERLVLVVTARPRASAASVRSRPQRGSSASSASTHAAGSRTEWRRRRQSPAAVYGISPHVHMDAASRAVRRWRHVVRSIP